MGMEPFDYLAYKRNKVQNIQKKVIFEKKERKLDFYKRCARKSQYNRWKGLDSADIWTKWEVFAKPEKWKWRSIRKENPRFFSKSENLILCTFACILMIVKN